MGFYSCPCGMLTCPKTHHQTGCTLPGHERFSHLKLPAALQTQRLLLNQCKKVRAKGTDLADTGVFVV